MYDRPRVKIGIASLAVTGLVSSGLLLAAGTASAVPGFEFDRIAGSDRFATSALVAEEIGDGANAILANGQAGQFADALAANYLAGDLDAPVYLTRKNSTPASISAQLRANGVESVTVVGGEGAISAGQVDDLEADGYDVTRVSGGNRFETNAEIIDAVGDAPEGTALVATGLNFADALAGGPLAERGHPIALASRNGVPDGVLDALGDAGVDSAIIVGGESAVGASAVDDLEDAGIDVITRLAGDGRADTSVAVAEYAVANLGLTDTAVNLASGDADGTGADALSGGVLTGQQGRPLLVTQSVDNSSDAVVGYLEDNSDTLTEGIIFGGENAVSADVQTELEEAGQGDPVAPPPTNPPTNPDPGAETEDLEITSPGDGELFLTGSEVTVEALVTDDDGNPVDEGVVVEFVVNGEVDDAGDALTAESATDEDGVATFEYTNTDGANTDLITASAEGEDTEPTDELLVEFVVELPENLVTLNPDGEVRYFRQISDALDEAVDGDDIIATGQFEENVFVDRSVTLTGDDATITGILDVGVDTNDGEPVSSGQGSVIDGFTVVANQNPTTIVSAPDVSFSNMTYDSQEEGVQIEAEGVSVIDSSFANHALAIDVNAEASTVLDNDFSADDQTDVYLDYVGAPRTPEDLELIASFNTFTPPDPEVDAEEQQIRPAPGSIPLGTPTIVDPVDEADITDTSVTLTLDEGSLEEGLESVTIYGEAGTPTGPADVDGDSLPFVTATEDAEPDELGYQVVVDELAAETEYNFAATQMVDGQESELGNQVTVTTAAAVEPFTITSAGVTLDDEVEGDAGAGDVWELVFSEAISADGTDGVIDSEVPDGGATRITLTGANGTTFLVQCGLEPDDGTDGVTAAACETSAVDDTLTDDQLRITLTEDAEPTPDAGGTPDVVTYPADIVDVSNLTSIETGADQVDLESSDDTVLERVLLP